MRKSFLCFLFSFLFLMNGCALIFQTGRRSDVHKIRMLEDELETLRHAKAVLEEKLSREIGDQQVRLSMAEKGLVITFVAEVLFSSGKSKLRKDSLPILSKVVAILKEEVAEHNIGIEGHTDNEPIKRSGWKSNWELSAHRALSVLYYLEDEGIASERLSAIGYGEHKPVASNDTAQGKQLNRRVEIVILPRAIKRIETGAEGESEEMLFEGEELK
ncbi:MAG: OmpA family protein [Candidatus Omnitrophota bacterium]|nr:MAG: OmpA family protein [Candidatus Omnitrophota bacterium]